LRDSKAPQYYSRSLIPTRASSAETCVNAVWKTARSPPASRAPEATDLSTSEGSEFAGPHYVRKSALLEGSMQRPGHESGLRVYTSLDTDLQKAARQSLLDASPPTSAPGWRGKLANVIAQARRSTNTRSRLDEDPKSTIHSPLVARFQRRCRVHFGRRTPTLFANDVPDQAQLATFSTRRHRLPQSARARCRRKSEVSLEQDSEPKERSSPSIRTEKSSHGWRPRFQSLEIQPRHAGSAPVGCRLSLRIHRRDRPGAAPTTRLWMRR